jgi:uncharacterized coiled-coil protein SlyX
MTTLNEADDVWARHPGLPRECVDFRVADVILELEAKNAAREQVLADVAEMATELARVLANYHQAFALVRQIRATLKRAREG